MACHTRSKSSMEATRYSMEGKLGVRAMELVENQIGTKDTVTGQGLGCFFLTFVRGRLHIAE